jgi:RimJ/RimL family protein N-acetyltransferase
MAFTDPVILKGHYVVLEPLAHEHAPQLAEAVRDGELWKLWYTTIPAPEEMPKEIGRRLEKQAEGEWLPFVVRRNDTGRLCGMTTYVHIEAAHRRLEIGATWYAKSAQRTGINTEAKLLLLTHAFEQLSCIAVELRTHFFNAQSRAAIERLGARQDGILRNHQLWRDGTRRDTVVYSIIDSEWPNVKRHLQEKLKR